MIAASEKSRIVFGCGNFGGLGSSPDLRDKGDGRERALALLDHAKTLGLTRLDTANTYGGGESERALGEWLRGQDAWYKASLQIATKVGNPHGTAEGVTPLSRNEVARHLDGSLQRLGIERIDLYYLHEFDHVTPIDETLEALDRALSAGKSPHSASRTQPWTIWPACSAVRRAPYAALSPTCRTSSTWSNRATWPR